ncbi:3-ketoacyl-CoA synthase 17 [Frankliniella fusca]|uniref:3-ketoacyl-CoA synthase 17 n=1 Tax=Frankliniella fusca TaxID=407009 RepID=A0AAE1L598_9NEOP|nr:3-ketoacyl-CoA synthase 17 [Frankliniella fusca]
MVGKQSKKEGKEPTNITLDQRRTMVQFIREHPGSNTGNFECAHNEQVKAATWDTLKDLLNRKPGASCCAPRP